VDSIIFEQEFISGDQFKYGLFSDAHIQPGEENKPFKKALDKCRAEGIRIHLNGDLADFITVKDPRYNKATDKARMAAVINEQVEWVSDFLTPYADLIDVVGIGNHEDVLIKHYGIDPIRFILRDLNRIRKEKDMVPIHYGSYRGYVLYRYKYAKGNKCKTLRMLRHHGGGGSAPVTGGAIDIARIMSGFDADIYHLGHKHKSTIRHEPIIRINSAGNIEQFTRCGVMTPGFQKPFNIDDFNADGGNCSFEDRFYSTNTNGWAILEVSLSIGKSDVDMDYTVTMVN